MAHGRSSRAGIVNGASNETRGQCGLAANPRAAPRVAHVIRLIGSVNRRALHRNETTLQASQLAGHARDLSAEVNECLLREAVLGHQLPDECGQLPQRRRQSVSVGWSPTGGNCRRRGVPCLRRHGGRRSRRGGFASRSRCMCSASPPRVRTRRGRPRCCRRRGLNRAALARDDVADVLQRRQSRRAVGGERVGLRSRSGKSGRHVSRRALGSRRGPRGRQSAATCRGLPFRQASRCHISPAQNRD